MICIRVELQKHVREVIHHAIPFPCLILLFAHNIRNLATRPAQVCKLHVLSLPQARFKFLLGHRLVDSDALVEGRILDRLLDGDLLVRNGRYHRFYLVLAIHAAETRNNDVGGGRWGIGMRRYLFQPLAELSRGDGGACVQT